MNIETHVIGSTKIAEVVSDKILVASEQDGLDLLGNVYYQGFDKVIIREENLTPDFFDLKNGLAGNVLQKFSNYRMQLSIVGDFTKFTGKSINDFMRESNKGGRISFVTSIAEALQKLS